MCQLGIFYFLLSDNFVCFGIVIDKINHKDYIDRNILRKEARLCSHS